VGLNISEPLPSIAAVDYYREPSHDLDGNGLLPMDAYDDPNAPANTLPDVPLDFLAGTPIKDGTMFATGTYTNVRTLFVQRLSDPTLPWNPEPNDPHYGHFYQAAYPVNPYITVDWATLDLTVFTGDEETNRQVAGTGGGSPQVLDQRPEPPDSTTNFVEADPVYPASGPFDDRLATSEPRPRDPATMPAGTATRFSTRKRGEAGGFGPRNIWSPVTRDPNVGESGFVDPPAPSGSGPKRPEVYFYHNLVSTLGILNTDRYGPLLASPPSGYAGSPQIPFSWLTFNNRPFANPLELTLVPASSPSRMLQDFSAPAVGNFWPPQAGTRNMYQGAANFQLANDFGTAFSFRGPFGYLLNLYHSRGPLTATGQPVRFATTRTAFWDPSPTGAAPFDHSPYKNLGADFVRIFDYVETPSPYVGTEKWYNPLAMRSLSVGPDGRPGIANFDDDGDGNVDNITELGARWSDDVHPYRPPFNRLSRFRDPGRVNVNTIFDKRVWSGIAKNFPDMDTDAFVTEFNLSRQGYGTTPLEFNPLVPTRFGNPFRTANSAGLMPMVSAPFLDSQMRQTFQPSGSPNPAYISLPRSSVDATLLRGRHSDPSQPLFYVDRPTSPQLNMNYSTTDRNAFFAYQGLNRLSSMLTTHSNVFAIWVTIGYFEVEANPAGPDLAHPDGYLLGAELGVDSGTARRHRAFYIVDRSIPVAFEPGENHNIDRAILVNRFIE